MSNPGSGRGPSNQPGLAAHHRPIWVVGAASLGVAIVLLAGCTAAPTTERPTTPTTTAGSAASAPASAPPGTGVVETGLAAVPEVAAKLRPSVVTVIVDGGAGSGVVYRENGLILTNEHVVRGHRDVRVSFADGQQVDGTVKAVDAITDVALLQVDRTGLPPVEFETQLPEVGSLAVVLGSPLGFENTVTAGIISGLHREIPGSAAQGQSLVDLIQTDAPISPGNSGGAVADARGRIIGISEAYIPPQAGAVSLGFAIPAATVVDIAKQLEESGQAVHAFAGLVPAPITPEVADRLGMATTEGVIVAEVLEGGPAAKAGLRPGDVITAVDGAKTATPEDFLAELREHEPGDTLSFSLQSPGQGSRQVDVTVSNRPR